MNPLNVLFLKSTVCMGSKQSWYLLPLCRPLGRSCALHLRALDPLLCPGSNSAQRQHDRSCSASIRPPLRDTPAALLYLCATCRQRDNTLKQNCLYNISASVGQLRNINKHVITKTRCASVDTLTFHFISLLKPVISRLLFSHNLFVYYCSSQCQSGTV